MLRFFSGYAVLLAFSIGAAGAALVVNQQNASASDENPGTESRPLKTISAAAAKVRAGDKVIIHGGDYREMVIVRASGTEHAPIVFEAAPGEKPVIKGSDVITAWGREENKIWKTQLPVLPARGASGEEPSYWRTSDVRQVFTHDGALLDAQRLRRVTERTAMEAGTFFCDTAASTLFVWLADSSSPVEHPPEVSVRCAWLYIYGNHIVVHGLAMRHASTTAIANWPACNLTGSDIFMEDCLMSWGDFAAISVGGKSNHLSHCLIACNGDSGGGGRGENHVIENCRFIFNNVDRYDTGWHAGGAKFIPNFQHSIIRHNEFAHNLGPGLWLDSGCNENVIDGNYAHDNEGPGIMVEISTGNLVMNNITVRNQNVHDGPFRDDHGKEKLSSVSEQMIAPSRFLKPYHAGEGRGIYISSAPGTKVLHNTAYLNEGEGICMEGPPRSDGTGMVATGNSVVMNNISVFNHGSQLTIRPPEAAAQKPSGVSDYNLLFSVGAVFAKNGWDGASTFELPQWQKTNGQDEHSLDADPHFAMAAMDDFRLLKSSPALHAGKPLPEVDHDYFGHPRDREKPALGALEAAAEVYPIPLANRSIGDSVGNINSATR